MTSNSKQRRFTGTKPPYWIPTVVEIKKLKWNGLTAISTFAGGGGSSTGLRIAGYRVPWANEFLEAARDTYHANWPDTFLDDRDIREVTAKDILEHVDGEVDLFDGSPPCKAFSTAGIREEGWGKTRHYADGRYQRNDDLLMEYARLVGATQPKAFQMENVKGLTMGNAKGFLRELQQEMIRHGYRIATAVLDAQWLGVPQRRQRVFVIGIRNDLNIEPSFPKPLPYRYVIADALPHLLSVPTPFRVSTKVHARAARGTWRVMNMSMNRASPTIDGEGIGATTHGVITIVCQSERTGDREERQFTINEIKRLQGFPDDYILHGSYRKQWFRLGESVPPPMAAAVSGHLATLIRRGTDS